MGFFPPSGKPLGMIQGRRIHHEPITPTAFQTSVTIATRFNDKMDKTNSLNCKTIQHFLRAMLGCLEGISSLFGGQCQVVWRPIQDCSRVFPGCLEANAMLFGRYYQVARRAFPGCLKGNARLFGGQVPGCLEGNSRLLKGIFRLL